MKGDALAEIRLRCGDGFDLPGEQEAFFVRLRFPGNPCGMCARGVDGVSGALRRHAWSQLQHFLRLVDLTKIPSIATALSPIVMARDGDFAFVQMEKFKIINIANDQTTITSKSLPFHDGMSIAPSNV